jgi:hypothetical protein
MKNFALCFFVFFLLCLNSYSLSKKSFRSTNKSQLKSKSKSKTKQNVCLLTVTRHAFLTSTKVAAKEKGTNNIWICAPGKDKEIKFYKFGGLSSSIKGTAPTTCTMMAANTNTELYVVSEKKLFFLSRNGDEQSYLWNEISGASNVVDVTVDNNNLGYFIDTSGVIFRINGLKAGDKLSDKTYGDECKLEAKFDSRDGFYIVKKDKTLIDVDSNGDSTLVTSIGVEDLCTDLNSGVYLAAYDGIYLMKSSVKTPIKVTNDLASSISCGSLLWFIGADGFVYQGVRK